MYHPIKKCILALSLLLVAGSALAEGEAFREKRSSGLSLELGWNGLVGFGPIFHKYISPYSVFDAGFGLSSVGWKGGLRYRQLFSKGQTTPFIGAGISYGTGTSGVVVSLPDSETNQTVDITMDASPFAQLVGGVEIATQGGFLTTLSIGYAQLLVDNNVNVVSGSPSQTMQQVMDLAYGSGIHIGLSLGYLF
ncbi:MAG: hypothetical protein OEZ43_07330 [Gammaproteobacteria bacterium]|nr:hypothetical protein [Gammaproteobacteria bacterium]